METRGVVAMSGTFGYEMDLGKCTAEEKETVREQTKRFKGWWQLIQEGDYYRLTDPFGGGAFTAWEHVSGDRREALVSIVMETARATPPFSVLRLRGLDAGALYQVNGSEELWRGDVLMNAGWPLPLPTGDYQAMQLYLCAKRPSSC